MTSSPFLATCCRGDHHFSVTNVSVISRRVGIAHHLNQRMKMEVVQTLTLGGERLANLPDAELIQIADAPREPELPPREALSSE